MGQPFRASTSPRGGRTGKPSLQPLSHQASDAIRRLMSQLGAPLAAKAACAAWDAGRSEPAQAGFAATRRSPVGAGLPASRPAPRARWRAHAPQAATAGSAAASDAIRRLMSRLWGRWPAKAACAAWGTEAAQRNMYNCINRQPPTRPHPPVALLDGSHTGGHNAV
jgi:hypothetical protein